MKYFLATIALVAMLAGDKVRLDDPAAGIQQFRLRRKADRQVVPTGQVAVDLLAQMMGVDHRPGDAGRDLTVDQVLECLMIK